MIELKTPPLVKYIFAVTFSNEEVFDEALLNIEKVIGEIDFHSSLFVFDHTDYYQEEMGDNLKKQFFSFANLRPFEFLVKLKRVFIELEKEYSKDGNRQVNLDPAYLELAKLVVATTKNFDHRIYIGQNTYGDIQLRYRKGRFVSNEWTYPDYKSENALNFFGRVRNKYFSQLKE